MPVRIPLVLCRTWQFRLLNLTSNAYLCDSVFRNRHYIIVGPFHIVSMAGCTCELHNREGTSQQQKSAVQSQCTRDHNNLTPVSQHINPGGGGGGGEHKEDKPSNRLYPGIITTLVHYHVQEGANIMPGQCGDNMGTMG